MYFYTFRDVQGVPLACIISDSTPPRVPEELGWDNAAGRKQCNGAEAMQGGKSKRRSQCGQGVHPARGTLAFSRATAACAPASLGSPFHTATVTIFIRISYTGRSANPSPPAPPHRHPSSFPRPYLRSANGQLEEAERLKSEAKQQNVVSKQQFVDWRPTSVSRPPPIDHSQKPKRPSRTRMNMETEEYFSV